MNKIYKDTLKSIILLFVLFSFFKCQNGAILPLKKLTPINKINRFNDSTYFRLIDGIRSWQNKFYLINSEAQRIVILDTNLNFLRAVGQKGRGPGDILAPTDVCKKDDDLYIADGGNKKISVFTKYKDNYRLKHEFKADYLSLRHKMCFTIADNLIYNVSLHSDKPIQTFSLKGNKFKRFGNNIKVETKHPFRKLFYIDFSPKVGIITVSVTEPVVIQYDINGNLLKKINLSDLNILRSTIAANKKYYESAGRNSISLLFSNICLQKQKLYLKLSLSDKKFKNPRNKVLVLHIDSNGIYPEQILELGNALVDVIGVSSDNKSLIAFDDIRGELIKFNL